MSGSLEKNLQAIEQRYPELAHRLRSLNSGEIFLKYKLKEGSALELTQGTRTIDSTAKDFLSPYPKSSTAHRVVFVQGFGLGTLLQQALNFDSANARQFVVIEPNLELFLCSLTVTDFSHVLADEKIIWLVGESQESIFSHLHRIFFRPPTSFHMDAFVWIEHPVIYIDYKNYFDDLQREWLGVRTLIRNLYGSLEDNLLGLQNVVKNTERIKATPGLLRLKDMALDHPAIVCSAGPSLKKSLPLVKELQDRALIVAVDAALKTCLDAGVVPHLVCTLERGEESKVFFEALSDSNHSDLKTNLVYYGMVPGTVVDSFPGEAWVVNRDYTYMKIMNQKLPRGIMTSGTSVGHMAAKVANYLGAKEICLVGQDLCFDPETSETHVAGVNANVRFILDSEEKLEKYVKDNGLGVLAWVPGNLDEKVRTHSFWYSFIKEFSAMKSQIRGQLVNCTEGGAQIPGVPWLRLEKVSANWTEKRDFFSDFTQVRKEVPAGNWIWSEAINFLNDIQSRLPLLANEARNAVDVWASNPAQAQKALSLLITAKRGLEENPLFFAFVLEMNGREHLEFENKRNLLTDMELKNSSKHFELLEGWYSSMSTAVRRVLSVLSER